MSFCQIATTYFAGFTKKYKAASIIIAFVFYTTYIINNWKQNLYLHIFHTTEYFGANQWIEERNWNDQMIQIKSIWTSFQGTEHPNNIAAWMA